MLKSVFGRLDRWMMDENETRRGAGRALLPAAEILVIGQTALLEANLKLHLVATMDVDTATQMDFLVRKKLDQLLREEGKFLDPVGHEAWMPEETEYNPIYESALVKGLIAVPVFILLSKAKYAAEKNRNLIAEYLASDDLDPRFFDLAEKYQVDLDQFV